MNAGADLDAELFDRVADRVGTSNGACGPWQRVDRTLSGRLDEAAAGIVDMAAHNGVVAIVQVPPLLVAKPCRVRRRVRDVGEEHGCEDPVRVGTTPQGQ
jgi:hypothetical protein